MAYKTPQTITPLALAREVDSTIISAQYHDINDTQFYVLEFPTKTVVSFRGTSTIGDAADDVRAYLVKFDDFECKIHKGFNDQFKDSIPTLTKALSHYRGYRNQRDIFFVGHSLGGALATVASVYFAKKFNLKVHVCTFGSPKVGDQKFVQLFSDSVATSCRYVNQDDIVTYAPWFWFYHVHGEIKLGTKRKDYRSYYLGRSVDHSLDSYEKNLQTS